MRITEHEASAIIEAVKAVDSDAQVWLFGSRADDGMMKIGYDEKLKLMSSLNWDYLDKHQDMLAVVEGRLETSGAFTRDKLFVRSLERLPWHYVVALWGVETIKELYTPEIAGRIWPKDRRYHFDFALAVLRREPLPPARWGDEHYKQMWRPIFSDRRDSAKPGLL